VEKRKMKICLYSPYIPKHTGGGEKYLLDVAKVLADEGHQVYIAVSSNLEGSSSWNAGELTQVTNHSEIRSQYEDFLNYSLQAVQFVTSPLGTSANSLRKLWWTKQFDVMYLATDGSFFFSLARKNVLHIQIPFTDRKKSILDKIKLLNWQVKNTNSAFTKRIIEKHWHTRIDFVHYPMVDTSIFSANKKKEKIILNVGRFFRQLHSKRQDVLVDIFKEMLKIYPQQLKGWKLVLIGSVEDHTYAEEIKKKTVGLPIEMLHSISHTQLLEWYSKSAIYWHATGYNINQEKEPGKTEHFGISTVEAMASGCIPVVIGKGGQPEVVGQALQPLLWNTMEECMERTMLAIEDKDQAEKYRAEAKQQAEKFNKAHFRKILLEMVQ
jgi:glycosyltransferase involved in cell wall biosynthesis